MNPVSGRGGASRRIERLHARAQARLGPVLLEPTRGPGDAARIAREAAREGAERLVVAGGDGTIGEVVTGLLSSGVASSGLPLLGLLPTGSGCDLARSLGLPRDVDAALEVVREGRVHALDVGRLEARDAEGELAVRWFANEASCGISAETIARLGRSPARLGARVAFAHAALAAVAGHEPFEARVEVDGAPIHDGAVSLLAISNGRYFGAGMKVAPNARLDDGRFEVVLVRGLSRAGIVPYLPLFYFGRHGRHPSVSFHAARRVEVWSKSPGVAIEVDGESGLHLPLRAEVVPAALRVIGSRGAPPAGSPRDGSTGRPPA